MSVARKRRSRARAQRIPPRAARYAKSPQPPKGAIVGYSMVMRGLVARWKRAVRARLLPLAEDVTRTDANDGAFVALERLGSSLADSPELGRATRVAADQTLRKSKSEFGRLGIKLREAEPSLDKAIASWRKQNVERVSGLFKSEAATLEKLLADGEGRRYESLAKDIEARLDIAQRRAEFIARDQVLTLNGQITKARQEAAGVEEYIWTTAGDERVRGDPSGKYPNSPTDHYHLDGTRQRWDDPPVTNEETGGTAHPGEDPNCRCIAYPVLPELGDDEEGGDGEPQAQPENQPDEEQPAATETPEPEAPAVETSPLVAKAEQLLRLIDSDTRRGDARDIIREQIARALPTATSKDFGRPLLRELRVEPMPEGVTAYHNTHDGSMAVSSDTLQGARRAIRLLTEGGYGEDFRDVEPRRYGPIESLNSLRTLVHEEVHGHSRVGLFSYRGVGRVLEEVGTESTARDIVRNLSPEISRNPFLYSAEHFGTYEPEIQGVRATIMRHAGVTEEAADELIRKAHAEKVLAAGPAFQTPLEHLDAFLEGLDLPADVTNDIRRGLLIRFGSGP